MYLFKKHLWKELHSRVGKVRFALLLLVGGGYAFFGGLILTALFRAVGEEYGHPLLGTMGGVTYTTCLGGTILNRILGLLAPPPSSS